MQGAIENYNACDIADSQMDYEDTREAGRETDWGKRFRNSAKHIMVDEAADPQVMLCHRGLLWYDDHDNMERLHVVGEHVERGNTVGKLITGLTVHLKKHPKDHLRTCFLVR